MKIELTKRYEIQALAVWMVLLGAAAAWLLLTRPRHRIEGDFLLREDQRNLSDGWLVAQLRSNIAERRARACLAMARIGDEQALDLLLQALGDPSARVRAMAAFAIGEIEDRETLAAVGRQPQAKAAEGLIAALGDPERVVVTYGVEALGKMRWQAAFPRITRTPAPLPVTMTALIRLGLPEAIPWIAARRSSDDQDTRWSAALALVELEAEIDGDITRSFLNLTRDTNPWVRAVVVRGLGRAEPSREVFDTLAGMTRDRDAKVRVEAHAALGRLGAPHTLPLLVSGLQDSNENVRLAAVEAMATLGDRDAAKLLQSLRFKPTALAYRAEWALSKLATREEDFFSGIEGVPSAYKNPVGMLGFVHALGNYRSPESEGWLRRLWDSREPYARSARPAILRALAAQATADLAPHLQAALDDPDVNLRRTALALMPHPQLGICRTAYQRAVEESATSVKLAALDAASRTEESPARKDFFLRATQDEDRRVRLRAVKHLRVLYGDDRGDKIGLTDTRFSEQDYQRIARTLNRRIRMETSIGELAIRLDYENAPLTAENFAELARQGYYDGQPFVVVRPGRFVQAGDRPGAPMAAPGTAIRSEINPQPFLRGSLGMVEEEKDSAASRFFICLSPLPLREGRYTNFGRLFSGDDLRDHITTETRILRVVVP